MTDTPDPRIEAVAKLLFTGPFLQGHLKDWDAPKWSIARGSCLMAAEDVLRGIDAANEWEYGWVARFDNGEMYDWGAYPDRDMAEEAVVRMTEDESKAIPLREGPLTFTVERRQSGVGPGPWEPLS